MNILKATFAIHAHFLKKRNHDNCMKNEGSGVKLMSVYFFSPLNRTRHSNCLFLNDLSLKIYLGKINQKFSKKIDFTMLPRI